MFYTGIGSRETPIEIQSIMSAYSTHLATHGWTLRSGGADGADYAFQLGVFDGSFEIYIPWNNFNGYKHSPEKGIYALSELDNRDEAELIASHVHPAWDKCTQGARKLHTRNVYQILGLDLKTPSECVIYWAKQDKHLNPKGGTATAVNLARKYDIKDINLNNEMVVDSIISIINRGLK